jgi:hypothetical protein
MINLKPIIIVFVLMLSPSLYAAEAPQDMKQFNVNCPAQQQLPVLDKAYHECSNGFVNGSCENFVESFRQLLPEYDCQRSFDATPSKNYIVPAIWLAGDGALEDYIRLLYRMTSPKDKMFNKVNFRDVTKVAKKLFGSKEFRHILDGSLAEEYMALSEKMSRELGHKKLSAPNKGDPADR